MTDYSAMTYACMYLLENSPDTDKDKLIRIQQTVDDTLFDNTLDFSYPLNDQHSIVLINDGTYSVIGSLDEGFKVQVVDASKIVRIEGRAGDYQVNVRAGNEIVKYPAASLIYCGDNNPWIKYDAIEIHGNLSRVASQLTARATKNTFTKSLLFTEGQCDYASKDTPACRACLESCEYSALVEDTEAKTIHLRLSDCTECGSCVAVCPSGAIQNSRVNVAGLIAALENTEGYGVLVATDADLMKLSSPLYSETVILSIPNYSLLNELYLSLLVLKSGGEVYFPDMTTLPVSTQAAICNVNRIFERFGGDVIGDIVSASRHPKRFAPIARRLDNMPLRMAVSEGLASLKGYSNNVYTLPNSLFSDLHVDDKCTLCMGCAYVCKSGAFQAQPENQSLALNPALCTGCGHCESICPEHSITLAPGRFREEETYVTFSAVAKDDVFCCVECGKPFATEKAIAKVAGMFASLMWDDVKTRTLYCCGECKPKLMLKDHFDNTAKGGY
ncbi:MAG: 4Fe-4S dicluster domain-containing protein [Sulfuricurvum sp.]|uniref:4Fe-4S dicluster domain-containing protein n=1 Tax=Sulfuricurvum sp. TaxID=2025608 RepID=UPI00271B2ACE|nr:4Fe-4S dicluster domain-containing protein [Sulfuricurvum sp.]MDO9057041.1 4Fe-4S dicluster domain-containing protein [Sulfuricurvum sp.]